MRRKTEGCHCKQRLVWDIWSSRSFPWLYFASAIPHVLAEPLFHYYTFFLLPLLKFLVLFPPLTSLGFSREERLDSIGRGLLVTDSNGKVDELGVLGRGLLVAGEA